MGASGARADCRRLARAVAQGHGQTRRHDRCCRPSRLVDCLLLQPGTYGVVRFLGQDLVFGRVDRLSLVFAYVFALMALVGMVYALHVKDDAQHVAALTYAGSALGITFAGDFLSLFLFWELMAVSAALLVWLRREPHRSRSRIPVSSGSRIRRVVPARRDRPLLVAVRVARLRRHVGLCGDCRVRADSRRLPSQCGGAAPGRLASGRLSGGHRHRRRVSHRLYHEVCGLCPDSRIRRHGAPGVVGSRDGGLRRGVRRARERCEEAARVPHHQPGGLHGLRGGDRHRAGLERHDRPRLLAHPL